MRSRVANVVVERDRVTETLRAAGWTTPNPQGNFVWLPVGALAADLGVALEQRGVVARAFPEVGVRVTISTETANDRFLEAILHAATDLGVVPR